MSAGPIERSWLVQRLDRPFRGKSILGADNPFAFGGGLKNGGLSDEAMGLLREVFSFDYMGAAEFEWGAVPKALQRIAQLAKCYEAWTFSIPLAKVPKPWRNEAQEPATGAKATIYVVAPPEWRDDIEDRVSAWATNKRDPEHKYRLKETTRLSDVLRPSADYAPRTCGWLELDNGFFFFTDEAMWKATADLFGVETRTVAA